VAQRTSQLVQDWQCYKKTVALSPDAFLVGQWRPVPKGHHSFLHWAMLQGQESGRARKLRNFTSSKVLFADFFDWVPSALVLQMEALRPSFAVPQGDRLLTLGPWVVYKNLWFKLDALGLQVWQNISQWNVTCFYFIP